jgi:hypothetical protein
MGNILFYSKSNAKLQANVDAKRSFSVQPILMPLLPVALLVDLLLRDHDTVHEFINVVELPLQ